MALKRMSSIITGTNRDLVQSERRYPQRALVLNLNTGEIRKGPGKWVDLKPAYDGSVADVVVAAATTGNVSIPLLNDQDPVDGVVLGLGGMVLLKNQSNPAQNGIYIITDEGAIRAEGFDTYSAHAGTVVRVSGGDENEGKQFVCTSGKTGTLGTTAIAFSPLVAGGLVDQIAALPTTNTATDEQLFLALQPDGTLVTVTGATLQAYITG